MMKRAPSYPRLPMLDQGPSFYQREPARSGCALPCRLHVEGRAHEAMLEDFSYFGCRIGCPGMTILVGSMITLELEGCAPVPALVKWSLGGKTGCVFRPRLDEERLRTALAALGHPASGA